jgi:hypothetical protein
MLPPSRLILEGLGVSSRPDYNLRWWIGTNTRLPLPGNKVFFTTGQMVCRATFEASLSARIGTSSILAEVEKPPAFCDSASRIRRSENGAVFPSRYIAAFDQTSARNTR